VSQAQLHDASLRHGKTFSHRELRSRHKPMAGLEHISQNEKAATRTIGLQALSRQGFWLATKIVHKKERPAPAAALHKHEIL
jgi:hypothetical protein